MISAHLSSHTHLHTDRATTTIYNKITIFYLGIENKNKRKTTLMGEETTKINEREKKTHILYRQINAHTHTNHQTHLQMRIQN